MLTHPPYESLYRTATCAIVLATALLLVACASPPGREGVAVEPPQHRSADRFWQHVDASAGHDWFHLLDAGDEAMTWRLRMIDSAHHAIDLETFLWMEDELGLRVVSHLLAAADRGVRVRVLLDDAFTSHEDLTLLAMAQHPNIDLRVYNPYGMRFGGTTGRTVFNLLDFKRVNHRMHNKALVVDGWAATIGGRNLADEYFGLHDEYNFRDMEVIVMGDGVDGVAAHFAAFWNSEWSVPAARVLDAGPDGFDLQALRARIDDRVGPAQVATEVELEALWRDAAGQVVSGRAHFVADEPARPGAEPAEAPPDQMARFIVETIDNAREEVTLVTAYLVPTEGLLQVIERTLARGVRVRILTNSIRSNNHLAAYAAYSGYIRELVDKGVALYELRTDAEDRNLYMTTPVDDKQLGLHAKFMLLDDDRVLIGSSNLDQRSLKLNTEVGLLVESTALNARLREAIAVDFLPRNAWSVQLDEAGALTWVGEGERLSHPPADSVFQQLEAWFIGLLPLDAQM
jgi:putative cardiolipin synthase